jgi:hypothetical protein
MSDESPASYEQWGKWQAEHDKVRAMADMTIRQLREDLEVTVQQRDLLGAEAAQLRKGLLAERMDGARRLERIQKLEEALKACLAEMKDNEVWPGWADRAEDLIREPGDPHRK